MTSLRFARRAVLLGAAFGAAGCDIAELVTNTPPAVEQTWNLPAPSTAVSVASLLPTNNSVQILPDSSAFSVTIAGANTSRRVGADCAPCESLNGTNAIKPAFVLSAASSTALPGDVVSAAVIAGTVNVVLTNNLSFDPLFVRNNPATQPQGFMTIVIRSGSLVLGRDSVNGATTPFAPGTQLNRPIVLNTGTIAGSLTFEVTVSSPIGDHAVPINADGILAAAASVPTLHVASVGVNVPNRSMSSPTEVIDLTDFEDMSTRVVGGALEMTITNPFAVSGDVGMDFRYGVGPSDVISKTVTFPAPGTQVQTISLSAAEMQLLLGNEVEISTTGTVTSGAPITVTPKQAITMDNRIILTIRVGGEN